MIMLFSSHLLSPHVVVDDVVFIPFVILALLSRSLTVVTQILGHKAGPSPPSPQRYVCVIFT